MFIKYFWPPIVWGIFIFIMSSFPGDDIPRTFLLNIPFFDKIIHFFFYFLLVILILHANLKNNRFLVFRSKHESVLNSRHFLSAFFLSFFYGVLLEVLQYFVFVMRSADFLDISANAAGSFVGLVVFYVFCD
ncbi:MAG: VanZ family protein [Bacteroidetes bacterium]|nr:VanZ family protein [Bacteroidota bacterium]